MIEGHRIVARIGILLVVITSGCMTSKKIKEKNLNKMADIYKSTIDGTYSNKIEGGKWETFGLWNLLIRSYNKKVDTVEVNNNMLVRLDMVSPDRLSVSLIDNHQVLSEFQLQGKIDDEYFSVKRKYFILPIPFLYLRFEAKNMIGTTTDGSLIIMHGYKREGWLLIMAAGSGGISENKFQRIN